MLVDRQLVSRHVQQRRRQWIDHPDFGRHRPRRHRCSGAVLLTLVQQHFGAAPNTDTLVVEYSTNGSTWSNLETVGPAGPEVDGGWVRVSWDLDGIIGDASQIQLRFIASDVGADTQSVVEAGVDALLVSATECLDAGVPGDADGDGQVNVADILAVIAAQGTSCNNCTEDLDGSGFVDVADLLLVIANW